MSCLGSYLDEIFCKILYNIVESDLSKQVMNDPLHNLGIIFFHIKPSMWFVNLLLELI